MAQTIHTQLQVSLLDKVSAPMKKVLASSKKLSAQVKKTAQVLERAHGPVKLIEDLRRQNEQLSAARQRWQQATERVRALAREMQAATRPSAALRREYEQAQRAVRTAASAFERQKTATLRVKHALEQAGVDVRRLTSEERRLREQAASANRVLERQQALLERMSAARERWHAAAARHGARMAAGAGMMYAGRRALEGFAAPVRAAVDFDAAFAQVRKLADFASKEEEKLYKQALVDMSKRIPVAVEGLADIMASALEAGMKLPDALRFTEMTAQAKVAFGMSAEAIGENAAKIQTALGLTVAQTARYLDVMNALSNNMASSAPDLVNFTRRVGAQGLQFGFSKEQVTAFGSALIATGAAPDVAATSFRNMGRALVKGTAATKRQNAAFEALGLSAVNVAKRMQKDAVATTIDVFRRLQALPDYKRTTVASQLFGDEARALGPLTLKLDELEKALRIAQGGIAAKDTVAGEFANRAAAADMQFQQLTNRIKAIGLTVGGVLLPPLIKATGAIGNLADKVAGWAKEYPTATKYTVYAGAALAGLVVVGGAAAMALGAVGMAASGAAFGVRMLGLRALFAAISSRRLTSAFGLLARLRPLRWAALIPRLAWSAFIPPLSWAGGLISRIPWAGLAGRLSWGMLVRPLAWGAGLISRVPWVSLAGKLGWGALIRPLSWGLRFIPVIGWAALAGQLAWDLLIKPLGWDKYVSVQGLKMAWARIKGFFAGIDWGGMIKRIDWANVALLGLPGVVARIVRAFTGIDLTEAGRKIMTSLWNGLKSVAAGLLKWAAGVAGKIASSFRISAAPPGKYPSAAARGAKMPQAGRAAAIAAARQKKASGGWMRGGLPALVGERGPELIYPSRAGWVAHNENVRRLARMAAAASVAAPLYYAPPAPPASAAAATPAVASTAAASRTVQITVAPGAIQIHAAGMSADQLSTELGRRLGDELRARMADVEDVG